VRAVRLLCELYPGIYLTTEVKVLWYYEYFLCKFWDVVGRPYSAFTFRYLKSNSQLRIPIFWYTNIENFADILTARRWGYCAFTKRRDPIIQWRSVASRYTVRSKSRSALSLQYVVLVFVSTLVDISCNTFISAQRLSERRSAERICE
jgi:hypothetical protein